MPIQINQPIENDFSNPLGLLSDCHRRIERFLNLLLTVTREAKGNKLDPEQRHAFDLALTYFRDRAPLHTEDEEGSLFPRMREKGDPQNENDLFLLDELHADHCSASDRHQEVDDLGKKWLDEGRLSSTEAESLIELLEALLITYADHISVEEKKIFPLAAVLLNRNDLDAISREMATRRGLVYHNTVHGNDI